MYKETAENTYSRVPYDPSLCQNEIEHETLSTSDVKRLIEEVLEQKQVIMVPKVTPPKGFPLSEELQRQLGQPGFELPQLSVYSEALTTFCRNGHVTWME